MNLDDINIDFDLDKIIKGVQDAFFKVVRTIFIMIFNLPKGVKIALAIFMVLLVIGIGYLTWKYREEWRYVKY